MRHSKAHLIFAVIGALTIGPSMTAVQQTGRGSTSAPRTSIIALPYPPGSNAIWGSTGQDASGHIWFGISMGGSNPNSAHLLEYAPESGQTIDRGNVVAELIAAGVAREGEQQAKIHSKIVPGPGGYLYFASMDEDGEHDDGSKLPTWGGHLWRLNLATHRWQHLLRVPEALIAVGTGGRYVYALGYFGHVLYQYDTRDGKTARIEVGSVDGHISRNVVVDDRGHAYVPRLRAEAGSAGAPRVVRVSLVEFGTDLQEIQATPIPASEYLGASRPTDAHGIVGLQTMRDGSILFTTHTGRLFRVTPPAPGGTSTSAAAAVTDVGWIHPEGTSYAASLFTTDGASAVATLAKRPGGPWDWVTCAWPAFSCRTAILSVPGLDPDQTARALLYGSATRDENGGHYLVGMGPGYRPIVIRVQDGAP